MTPLVTTRLYDPDTQLTTGTAENGIFFGVVPPFTNSSVIIIDATITGVLSSSDIGLGILSSNISISDLFYDVFDTIEEVTTPTSQFAGLSGQDGLVNVVDVGFRSQQVSKYVALMVYGGNKTSDGCCLTAKWFFGFDPGV